MRRTVLFLLTIISLYCSAQNWTESLNISNMEGMDNQPDLAVDQNGVFHCVWAHKIEENYWKIFYSKSTDQGSSWSVPEDISRNSEKWVAGPHIVCDSENHLHVTYDFDVCNYMGSTIYYKQFDGASWNEPINVSEGMPESHANKLVIDNKDRVYCFWYRSTNNGTTFYRYLENGLWSDYFIPYNNNDFLAFSECSVDSGNNMHWIGAHHYESQSAYDIKAIYIHYDYVNNLWSDFIAFGENHSGSGFDIDLDKDFLPHLVWQEFTNDSVPPSDGTLYVYNNGISWSIPELIVEDPMEQQIVIDENNAANIFDIEKTEEGSMFVHYYYKSGLWEGYIIDESDWYGMFPVVENYNNKLLAIYAKPLLNINGEIFFSKSDIITNVENTATSKIESDIFPNPFNQLLHIRIRTDKTERVFIKIYTLEGKLLNTLIKEATVAGDNEITWNSKDQNGNSVPSGTYLIRFQSGRYVMTRSVILAN